MTFLSFLNEFNKIIGWHSEYIEFQYFYNARPNTSDFVLFHSDEELINFVSSKSANIIYGKNKKILSDLEPIHTYDETALFERFMDMPIYIGHISLSDIGISRFGIIENSNVKIINYSKIPSYERMILDNFIFNKCMDQTIKELSNITAFNVSRSHLEGIPGDVICLDREITHINNTNQLRMYVEGNYKAHIMLLGSLLTDTIEIPGDSNNLKFEDIPNLIELDVALERECVDEGNEGMVDDYYIYEPIQFQIIVKPDKGLILVPKPSEIKKIIETQIDLWQYYIVRRGNAWFVPKKLLTIFQYMLRYNIESDFGEVANILDYNQSLECAKNIDNDEYRKRWVNNVYMYEDDIDNYPNYADSIKSCDRLIVIMK